jgi:hypothetical protein
MLTEVDMRDAAPQLVGYRGTLRQAVSAQIYEFTA